MEDSNTALAPVTQPTDLIGIMQRIVETGLNADGVLALEKLLDMQERIAADQRKTAFMAAMSRLHAKLPQIQKDGRIIVKGVERSRYARLEDIHTVLQPLMAEEGFSASFDEEAYTESTATFVMTVSHRDGHAETKRKTVPHDKAAVGQYGPIRSAIQDASSTASYARRILYKMHFDIVECGEDTDGTSLETVTAETVKDLETALQDTKSDKAKFLAHFKIAKIEDLLIRDLPTANDMIQAKRRNQK